VFTIFQVFASRDEKVIDANCCETAMLLVPSEKKILLVVLTIID
jgi:hypothetical protein